MDKLTSWKSHAKHLALIRTSTSVTRHTFASKPPPALRPTPAPPSWKASWRTPTPGIQSNRRRKRPHHRGRMGVRGNWLQPFTKQLGEGCRAIRPTGNRTGKPGAIYSCAAE